MDTNKNDSDNSPASSSVSPKEVLTPPTQPLPKGSKSHGKISTDPKNTKDSDPTQ